MTKIKLLTPHTHQGLVYQSGDVVEVTQSDADFIVKHQIGEIVNTTKNKQQGEQ